MHEVHLFSISVLIIYAEMGFFSHRVNRSNLREGDHIYTWRNGMAYAHHGIYVGDGNVIHYTVNNSMYSSTAASSDGGSRVEMISLDGFLRNGALHRFQYGVSGAVFNAKIRAGTCTTAESDPPEEVIRRARSLLDKGFGNYHLLTNNCEMFALYCKTGLVCPSEIAYGQAGCVAGIGISVAAAVFVGPSALAVPALGLLPLALGLGAGSIWGLLTSISRRYYTDLGVLAQTGGAHRMEVEEYCQRFHGMPLPNSTQTPQQRSFPRHDSPRRMQHILPDPMFQHNSSAHLHDLMVTQAISNSFINPNSFNSALI